MKRYQLDNITMAQTQFRYSDDKLGNAYEYLIKEFGDDIWTYRRVLYQQNGCNIND